LRLLVDTHVLLWSLADPERLAARAITSLETVVTHDRIIGQYGVPIIAA
jgi:PIN domain nuclease of toxin-antitoxin system